ncbi:phenylalanine--tRNA ligase subunit beta [Lacibacterium aquatile]|uniref:Phenylalanine--tRNA ligase beta subunit n=1 Tax=Lacibacterium aquatile TaxID=1168082 RepID=A0ABW5DLY9_9PROT
MKFSLSWLLEHFETQAPLELLLDTLTDLGLEVEGVEDKAAALAGFTIARIKEAKQHPNADRLRVCTVETGTGPDIQVVCGAPNARTGLVTVLAVPGQTIPRNGTVLKKGEIRGEASEGMMCSGYELGLTEDHEGIMELPADAPIGAKFAETMGLADPVVEIAITPNRADALGVRGIARDLAAKGLGQLKPLPYPDAPVTGTYEHPVGLTITPDAAKGCPVFYSRHFKGVKNGESPEWLKARLQSIGLKPISALVDITNFLTFDLNRPAHVFDAGKLAGDLVVRPAKAGETLLALNGKEYALEDGMTVIADDKAVLSLGGIMGGETTGVTEGTTEVVLEMAYFDMLSIARTGRKLGILSDARFRNERGIDPAFTAKGIEIATRLILEICGGEASDVVVAGHTPDTTRTIHLRPARTEALTGIKIDTAEQVAILEALGFEVTKDGEKLAVVPPSWRGDVEGEADLIEEVMRVHGIDQVPETPLPRPEGLPTPAITPKQLRDRRVRRILAGQGLMEAVTWSFLDHATAVRFGGGDASLTLTNPIASDLDQMRPSALPNLLRAAARNLARGAESVALFEVGPAFNSIKPDGQTQVAIGLRVGPATERHWRGGNRPVDAFDAKEDLYVALRDLGLAPDGMPVFRDTPDWYHPGRSGVIKLGPKNVLARFGALHPSLLEDFGIDAPAVAFELFLDMVPMPKTKGRARPTLKLASLQPVRRDFAFLVDASVEASVLLKAVKDADKGLIVDASLFDVYAGKGVPEGKKSVAVSITLQPTEKTLTDAEIEAVAAKVTADVVKVTGGSLRG